MRGRPVLCCPAFAVQRAGTAVPPHLPALKQPPEGAVPAPAAHWLLWRAYPSGSTDPAACIPDAAGRSSGSSPVMAGSKLLAPV